MNELVELIVLLLPALVLLLGLSLVIAVKDVWKLFSGG